MWKNQNKHMLVTIALGFVLILSILLYYSLNQAPTERRETEPTREVITKIEMTDEPVIEEHTNNELNPEVVDVVEETPLDQPPVLSLIRAELSRKAQETFMQPGWLPKNLCS